MASAPIKRANGTYQIRWRQDGEWQSESFGAKGRAEKFKADVERAGNRWPAGWLKGHGFASVDRTDTAPQPSFKEVALAYAEGNPDITPGTRKDYLTYARVLPTLEFDERRPFDQPVDQITEDDVRAWVRHWNRSLKTKSNYHGFISGVFKEAQRLGYRPDHPALRTAPKRRRVKQQQREPIYLRAEDWARLRGALEADAADICRVLVGTGLRWSELTALWVEDVDLGAKEVHVRKAWKEMGEDGEQEMPDWIRTRLQAKHRLRGHYLGSPKTPKSARTLKVSPRVVEVLEEWSRGKAPDDFVFQTKTGRPWHGNEFHEQRWAPARRAAGLTGLHVHDLRHTFVFWQLAGKERLEVVSRMLGHESYAFTVDVYHRLIAPDRNPDAEAVMDANLEGGLRAVSGGAPADAAAPSRLDARSRPAALG